MTLLDRLQEWQRSGAITPQQYERIAAIERGDRFSLFVELNVLLYLGVVSAIAGLAWTIQTHFARLGDAAIVISLTMLCVGSFYYCFATAPPYSPGKTESPTMGFAYVLYLGALAFGLELAYIESRVGLLDNQWDYYFLLSAAVLFPLAYRFDNRLVLSLALSSLAGWFGLSLTRHDLLSGEGVRLSAIVYGVIVGLCGTWLSIRVAKEHFLRTYLHVAANAILLAVTSGAIDSPFRDAYLVLLLFLAAAAVYAGIGYQEFAFAGYGTVYGYVGVTARVLETVHGFTPVLVYLVLSGTAVIVFLGRFARTRRHE